MDNLLLFTPTKASHFEKLEDVTQEWFEDLI